MMTVIAAMEAAAATRLKHTFHLLYRVPSGVPRGTCSMSRLRCESDQAAAKRRTVSSLCLLPEAPNPRVKFGETEHVGKTQVCAGVDAADRNREENERRTRNPPPESEGR